MTAIYCAVAVTIFSYVTGVFMTFFITISLQFDAFRIYMRSLIAELDDAIKRHRTDVDDDKEIKTMLEHIVCFHVAAKK